MTQLKLGHCLAFSSLLHNISIPPIAVLPLSENLSVNTALQHFCREITVPVAQNREQNLLLYCIKQPCVKLCKVALLKDQTSIFGCHGPMPGEYTTSSAVFWGFSSIIPHCLECTCPGLGKACQVHHQQSQTTNQISSLSDLCSTCAARLPPCIWARGLFSYVSISFQLSQGVEVSSASHLPYHEMNHTLKMPHSFKCRCLFSIHLISGKKNSQSIL